MIFGNNNRVDFEDSVLLGGLSIYIGTPGSPCDNAKVRIGAGTTFSGPGTFRLMEDDSEIAVGRDVMFSEHVDVWCSDTHSILNEEGNARNVGKFIKIGDHVWIGKDVKISKNTEIKKGSIVGWGSVVPSGTYNEASLIAGNPARIRRENVVWSRETPKNRNLCRKI